MTQQNYLQIYVAKFLNTSAKNCLANFPDKRRLTAVCISQDMIIDLLL